MISFSNFQSAFNAFKDDLGLVGHPQDPKMSVFTQPRKWGKYNLTLLPKDLSESDIKEKLEKIKVIGVTCMDKRVASGFYQEISKGYEPDEVFLFTVGGGIVQAGDQRRKALKDILDYLSDNCPNLKKVVVSDHDCRCGAVAFWLKAKPGKLPKGFGQAISGTQEKKAMKTLISEGYISLVPQDWKDRGFVAVWLVSPDEKKKSLEPEPFDPYLTKARRVEDFK